MQTIAHVIVLKPRHCKSSINGTLQTEFQHNKSLKIHKTRRKNNKQKGTETQEGN